jgi:hypothetical protein
MSDFIVRGSRITVARDHHKALQEVSVAITAAKIRAMCPRSEVDGIAVPLVDGVSYAQFAMLSAALGTTEIYVDLVPGVPGESNPGCDHMTLTINWDPPRGS